MAEESEVRREGESPWMRGREDDCMRERKRGERGEGGGSSDVGEGRRRWGIDGRIARF